MAQANFTPIQLYRSTTASAVPTSGNLADGELAINTNDGKLYYKDSGGTVQLIASKAGASGDVVGPASATDNAVVRFDGTTGKLVQNSVVTIADSTGDISGVGQLNATTVDTTNLEVTNIKAIDGTAAASIANSTGVVSITANPVLSGGTANGVLYLNGSKVATSGSALTFDGTTATVNSVTNNTGLVVSASSISSSQVNIGVGVLTAGRPFVGTNTNTNPLEIGTRAAADTVFVVNSTERARITSGGDLLVGTTSAGAGISGVTSRLAVVAATSNFGGVFVTDNAAYHDLLLWNTATSGNNAFVEFATEGTYTARGSITYNRAGGLTVYNTTSDYRAKDIIGPVQNPGATIDALKVYEGKMKGATQSRPMLVAHEAQAHAPYAVTGEKDAFNEDGTPKFQQIDVSSLVPLLLAEIQSLRQRVALLEGN